jgi:hypothetical protein
VKYRDDDVVVPILVWRERDYERAKELADDDMMETWEGWKKQFRAVLRGVPPGAIIVRIEADPDEVAEWCKAQGLKVTSDNRAKWAIHRFARDNDIDQD